MTILHTKYTVELREKWGSVRLNMGPLTVDVMSAKVHESKIVNSSQEASSRHDASNTSAIFPRQRQHPQCFGICNMIDQ